MIRTESDKPLLCPSSEEFAQELTKLYPNINVGIFIDIARSRAALRMRDHKMELAPDATNIQRIAWERNRDMLVGIDFSFSLPELIAEYNTFLRFSKYYLDSGEKSLCFLDKERNYAKAAGFDDIKEIPEIDRQLPNGMTLLAQTIMLGDDVQAVRDLVDKKGASPVALCGSMTPLNLALQLGRTEIAEYLSQF